MLIRYVHTNIISEDWKKLALFYEQVFDCERVLPPRDQIGNWLDQGTGVREAHLQGMHLRLPGCGPDGPTLEIYQYDDMEFKPPPAANRQGFGHIAFRVDDVDAMRAKILAQGGKDLGQIAEAEVPGLGSLTFVYMTDPEGNILEIQKWS